MLTGRIAFAGQTVPDTIAAILEREPDWNVLPAGTPRIVRKMLVACLQKDVARRLRDIGDARSELEDTFIDGDAARPDKRWWRSYVTSAAILGGS